MSSFLLSACLVEMSTVLVKGQTLDETISSRSQHSSLNHNKINNEIDKEQFGFRKHSGTREALRGYKILTEKYREVQKSIICDL
jgi:hypothetical protein